MIDTICLSLTQRVAEIGHRCGLDLPSLQTHCTKMLQDAFDKMDENARTL